MATGISFWHALGIVALEWGPDLPMRSWNLLLQSAEDDLELQTALEGLAIGAPTLANGLLGSWLGGRHLGQFLDLRGVDWLTAIPKDLIVEGDLILASCIALHRLPKNLSVAGDLELTRCISLRGLPTGLRVGGDLWAAGCTALSTIGLGTTIGGSLILRDCSALASLSKGLNIGGTLNLGGCLALKRLPKSLVVQGDVVMRGCSSWDGQIPEDAVVGGQVVRRY
jgi:hypothetical protein